eukprot:328882-Amorphochlora_amoeboformis.AAC.1
MAELHGRKPLFKGENYKDQVCEIIRILGVPSKEDFDAVIQNNHAHRYVKRYLAGNQPDNTLPPALNTKIYQVLRIPKERA